MKAHVCKAEPLTFWGVVKCAVTTLILFPIVVSIIFVDEIRSLRSKGVGYK